MTFVFMLNNLILFSLCSGYQIKWKGAKYKPKGKELKVKVPTPNVVNTPFVAPFCDLSLGMPEIIRTVNENSYKKESVVCYTSRLVTQKHVDTIYACLPESQAGKRLQPDLIS